MSEFMWMVHRPNPSKKNQLTAKEVYEILGYGKTTFYAKKNLGLLPKEKRLGKGIRWDQLEVETWIEYGMPDQQEWEQIKVREGLKF